MVRKNFITRWKLLFGVGWKSSCLPKENWGNCNVWNVLWGGLVYFNYHVFIHFRPNLNLYNYFSDEMLCSLFHIHFTCLHQIRCRYILDGVNQIQYYRWTNIWWFHISCIFYVTYDLIIRNLDILKYIKLCLTVRIGEYEVISMNHNTVS